MSFFSIFAVITLLIGSINNAELESGNLVVEIPNIKEQQGKIIILLFSSKEGFPDDLEKAAAKAVFDEYSSSITYLFEGLSFGTYAIVIAQDKNNNGKIDRARITSKPKEPIGMSNVVKLSRPNFTYSKFDFDEDGMKVTVNFLNQ